MDWKARHICTKPKLVKQSMCIQIYTCLPTTNLQAASDITRLPPQLLACVLQCIPRGSRLRQCALVDRNWNTAAAIATRKVGSRNWRTSLSSWLQSHAAEAAIESISVHIEDWPHAHLLLPLQQLDTLRELNLDRAWVSIADGPSAAQHCESAVLPEQLSQLTSLVLRKSPLRLSTLPAFTQLRHLVCSSKHPSDVTAERAGSIAVARSACLAGLGQALPGMQHLTYLELGGGWAQDPAVKGVQHLPRLQVTIHLYSLRREGTERDM